MQQNSSRSWGVRLPRMSVQDPVFAGRRSWGRSSPSSALARSRSPVSQKNADSPDLQDCRFFCQATRAWEWNICIQCVYIYINTYHSQCYISTYIYIYVCVPMHNMYITIPHAICSFTHVCSLYVCMYVYVYIYICDPALTVPPHQPPKGMGLQVQG